jgi:NCAIR mutase (PurE)-related protein
MSAIQSDVKNPEEPSVITPEVLVYDRGRAARIGLPEAVFCLDKHVDDVVEIAARLTNSIVGPVLFTRMSERQHSAVVDRTNAPLDYDEMSGTAFLNGTMPKRTGRVGIVTAGTSDRSVALEARRTLEFLGIDTTLYVDIGVAGLYRLLNRVDELRRETVLIAVAGMDAALASVVGGLVACPVIGVPTSTGYGASRGGETALNAMLASCAQGVVVTNIDNGFGAACAAARILGPDTVGAQ